MIDFFKAAFVFFKEIELCIIVTWGKWIRKKRPGRFHTGPPCRGFPERTS